MTNDDLDMFLSICHWTTNRRERDANYFKSVIFIRVYTLVWLYFVRSYVISDIFDTVSHASMCQSNILNKLHSVVSRELTT